MRSAISPKRARSPVHEQLIAVPSRQDMDVEMRHRLRGARTIRLDEVQSVRRDSGIDSSCDFDRATCYRREGFRLNGKHIRIVRLGDHERMPVMDGIDVEKR